MLFPKFEKWQRILLKLNFFSISKPQVVYLRPFLSSLPFSKFLNENYIYEICPESIGPTFISPRHSVRATSAEHERQQ